MTAHQHLFSVDRRTASLINPLISPESTSGTLRMLKEITSEMGCFTSPHVDKAMQLLLAVAGALSYEEAATRGERTP